MKLLKSCVSNFVAPMLVLCVTSGGALAYSTDVEYSTQQPTVFKGILFAQGSVSDLSESDLRRLNFYTSRTLDALAALTTEDALAGTEGTAIAGDTVTALREAITRLVDAGKRSGLSQDVVADFFMLAVQERFQQEIPLALQDASGEIDARLLFSGVIGRPNIANEREVDVDYLAILDEESVNLDLGVSTSTEEAAAEIVVVNAGPLIREGADAATRAIISRVVVDGDVWRIEVVSGDTLATLASAIYGDSLAYRQIYTANSNILSNINSLDIGQILTIPKP